MRRNYNISIPEPCHENWQEMTATGKGRFCASCQKNVIDFTNASDSEIIKTIKQNNRLCGRFSANQLNRDLIDRKEKSSFWIAASTAILSFLNIGNFDVIAQETPKTEQTDKKVISENDSVPNLDNQEITISGKVLENELPLPGVSVVAKGTTRVTQTDIDGNFSIKAKYGEILVFSFIGMKSQEFVIQSEKNIAVNMTAEVIMLGEYITVRRTFFGRIFQKIGNWFR